MKKIIIISILIILLTGCDMSNPFNNENTIISNEGLTSTNKEQLLAPSNTLTPTLSVTFLQNLNGAIETDGDAIFIECGDVDILIDAGTKGTGTGTVVPYIQNHVEDNIIELVILTHGDEDHIGGMVGFVGPDNGALEVPGITYQNVLDSGVMRTTQTYGAYYELLSDLIDNGTNYHKLRDCFDEEKETPNRFILGEETYIDVLDAGQYNYYTNTVNDQSVGILLVHKQKTFLLTGDAEEWLEEKTILDLQDKMDDLEIDGIDVFKANHHGSDTSNVVSFLDVVNPEYVVISSSYESTSHDNPSKIVVDRLDSYTQKTYGIFLDGNITMTSNGSTIIATSSLGGLTRVKGSDWWNEDNPDNPRP